MEEVVGVAPQARKDFVRGPAMEFAGMQAINYIAARDVSDRGIVRHDAKVERILYFQLLTQDTPRHILVYLTSEGLVTDEDVIAD